MFLKNKLYKVNNHKNLDVDEIKTVFVQKKATCNFPFLYQDKIHWNCIYDGELNGNGWCMNQLKPGKKVSCGKFAAVEE